MSVGLTGISTRSATPRTQLKAFILLPQAATHIRAADFTWLFISAHS